MKKNRLLLRIARNKKQQHTAKPRKSSALAGTIRLLVASFAVDAPAATYLWDSNTGTTGVQDGAGTWSSVGTTWWNPALAGSNVAITSADIGLFGASGIGGLITLSGNQSLLGMSFGQTATTGYSFTAGSATTLTLGASGISVLQGAQPVSIGDANLSLVLSGDQTWTNRSADALTIGGGIANGTSTLTLNCVPGISTAGLFTLNGALTGGAGGLTVARGASATLTANNGYNGATVIGNASTLTVSGAAGRISGTSGISLNGGNLTMLSVTGEQTVDRVNAAPITSNGGTVTWTNPNADAATWAETLGVLSLAKGQTNIVTTNAVSATQSLTLGTGSLTHAAANTSTIAFAGPTLGATTNRIFVTGEASTGANLIIGPWATFGSTAAAQTDYAIYNATTGIQARNVANSAQTTWGSATNSFTTTSTTPTLTATRTTGSLRYNAAAGTLSLGTSTFDLQTFGLLNGGTGLLTIANGTGGTGGVTTPTGGDNTLFLIAGNNAITFTTALIKDNGTAVNVVKSGANTVTLAGNQTYTGVTTVNSGILASGTAVTATFNGGAASWLGASAATAGNLVLNGGTLRYAGPTAGTTDRLFTLGEAGGTIENSAASNGTLTFAGPGSIVAAGTGDRTLGLNANGTGTFTFSPVIVDPTGGGKTSLVINSTSSGAVVLLPAAANTFTGGITVNARTIQLQTANGWGSNVISFGTGTTPQLDLRSNAAVNFTTGFTNGLNFGNNTGTVSLSAVSASNGVTHTIGTISIGNGTFNFNRGSNLNTNNSSSLTTGVVTLTGNPTFNLNAGSGSAAPLLNIGGLDDGGVARTITITGGAAGTGKQYFRLFNNLTNFTAGTNIIYNGGNVGGVRLDTANSFGTATNPGLVTFNAPSTVGGVRLLNNTANTNFTTNWVLGNNSVLFDLGGTSANQTNKGLVTGTLSIGTATMTLSGAINTSTNNVYSLTMGVTTFTGDATLAVANINGTGIGSLTLGALNDGAAVRALTKNGAATLQLNTAATSIIAGTTLTTTAGITQVGNATAFGSGTLNVGDGTTTGQLLVSNGVTLSNSTIVTYLGGAATLGTGSITGPTTGTGTINSALNINAAPGADTGHFQGGGGTLNITGPIVTGGTSGGEVVVRAGNVGLNNATGNTYTSLRVNAGTTTVGANDAIPTTTNVFLADVGATAAINIGAGLSQTIGSGATWMLGGSGPTLENNVGTIATGTGTLVLNGTLANNTGSLATQLVTGAVSFGGTAGTFDIDSGHATSDMTVSASLSNGSLIKNGAGILTLTGTKTLTDLTINGGAVVAGYGTSGVQTITIGTAGSLQLVNSLAETLTLAGSAGSLNVAGGARIGLELGAPLTSDTLTVGAGGTATTTGTITLDFYNLGGLAAGTYTLLTAPSGLTAGGTTYNVGSAPLGFNYAINATDSLVQLTTTAYTPKFWKGLANSSWNTLNIAANFNWSNLATGLDDAGAVPGSLDTVIFSAANATGPTISTTLDAAFTVDAVQFLAAPAGVTAVNIGAGTGGTLTISPATSSAGIFVDTNAGTATFQAGLPVTIGTAQTWNVVGGGANGSTLVMAADVNFNGNSVTKSGAGALTLAGTNSGAGTLTLSAGTLNLNSSAALGGANFTINGGTTLNNSSGGAIAVSTTNAITLNGNFTFTGTRDLSFAGNAVSLPTNVSITSSAGNLTFNAAITESGGSRSLTKLGAGALTLGGNNAFAGGVNLSAGTLNVNNAGALGTGTLTITSGTLDNTSGSAITNANNNAQTWSGNFAFTGSNNLNLGTGAVSLGAGAGTSRTITVNAGTIEVGGIISNGAVGTGITKLGNGTLVLGGASNYTGNTVVNAGTLNLTGSLTGDGTTAAGSRLQLGTVAGNAVVNIAGNISDYFSFTGGGITAANTAINQTSGITNFTSTSTGDTVNLVNSTATGSYGSLSITGGTMNTLGRVQVSRGSGGGVAYIGGTGTLNAPGEWFMVTYGNANALGSLTIGPGGTLNRTSASNFLGVFMNQANQYGIVNLTGGTLITGGPVTNNGIRFGNGNGGTNNTGFLNLAAGTFQTYANVSQNVGTSTGQNVSINLAGATLQALGNLTAALPSTNAGQTVVTTLYGLIDNAGTAQDFTGGFTVDTNGFSVTLANPIVAPSASGVAQSSLSITGGTGYIGAPVVQFTGGTLAAGGSSAAGYAVVSGGQVTEIVITSPGSYTAAPTLTLTGGGGTGASVTVATLVANTTTAGITKNGAGTLIMSNAASSFTGAVTVNGGTLQVQGGLANIGLNSPVGTGDSTSPATNAASIVLNGGTLATNIGAPTTTDRLFTVTQNGGAVESNNTTAANTITYGNTSAIVYSGAGARTLTFGGANPVGGTNTFAPLIGNAGSDAVTLNKTGVSNWFLTNASNAYTGGTNIAGGVLTFVSGALNTTGNITFTGSSTLRWGTGVTDDLSSRLFIADTFTGTVDTNGNNVTFATAVGTTGGTTGVLRKTGAGALTLNAAAAHAGGTELNAGTLNIGHLGALGAGTFTISGASTFDNTTGGTGTLTGNPAQAWNGDFTFTGTNNLNLGTGAVNLSANRAVTVTANTLTVDGFIGDTGGDFGLTKNGPGTLVLTGVNTFGADDNVTITGGTLIVNGNAALGANTNNVIFQTGASTLRFTDNASFGAAQYFRVASIGATIEVDAGKLVELAGGATSSATNGINTNGGTNGPGASLTKTGLGTLRISGGNGFFDGDGGWVVTQGTLSIAGTSTQVLGDANPTTVELRLNGGTVSYDTDLANIVDAAIDTTLQANSTVVSNVETAGAGIVQRLNNLTVNAGGLTLNVQGGANVTSGTASIVAGATTLSGDVTFNITNPTGGGLTQLTVGVITGGANAVTLTGNGNFIQTGAFATTAATALTLNSGYTGLATLSQANTYSGVTAINGGTLAFSTSGNLGDASATNDVTLGGGTLRYTGAGAVDLTANRQINLTTGTTSTIEVSGGLGDLQVTGGISTSGAANLTKAGIGKVTVSGVVNLNGGNLTVNAGAFTGGFSATGANQITISGTGSLQLVDSTASTLTLGTGAGALTLNGGARLGFELGATTVNDRIDIGLGGTALGSGGVIALDFYALGGFGAGTYTLLTAPSGLLSGGTSYVLGNAPGGFNYVLTQTDAAISLTTSILSNRYWTNSQTTGSWNTLTVDPFSNFSTDPAGLTNSAAVPTSLDTVIFSATSVVTSPVNTTLDAAFTIDSLVFNANPAGGTFSIAAGTGGTLNLSPVSASNGITVGNNGGAVTISAPLTAGTTQTWSVDGTGTSSLVVSGNTTFSAGVTKTGAGALTLSGSNSGAGGFTLSGGTLNIGSASALGTGTFTINAGTTIDNTSAGPVTLSANNVQNWNGSFTYAGATQSLNLGTGAVTLGATVQTTVTTNILTVGGAIDDGAATFGLTKLGAGTLVLNGNNAYDGLTTLTNGALTLAGDNSGASGGVTVNTTTTLNINHAAALGTGTFTINAGTLNNTSGADIVSSTNNAININGNINFTGANSLNLGTGPVFLGATPTINVLANTLTFGGSIDGLLGVGITKTGIGTLTLSGLSGTAANNYSGTTILDNGTTNINTAASFTGGLTFGAATANTTPVTLNLPNGATFAGTLLVQNNTATANTITLGSGQTLTLNGNTTIGAATPGAANATARLTIGGGGNLVVATAAGGTFQVGGSTGGTSQASTLDLTGLATASINVSATGTVRVNQPTGTNVAGNQSTLLLPTPTVALNTSVTTITAANLNIGDNGGNGGGAGQVNSVTLGTGLTTLNVNIVNIGTGGRDLGQLIYASGNGTLKLRAADGTGRAGFNLGTGNATTGVAPGTGVSNNVDLSGHSADLLITTLAIGAQNRLTDRTDTFAFDTGTLDATTVVLGTNTGTASTAAGTFSPTWTSNLNIGGGTTTIGTGGVDIGFGQTAPNSGSQIGFKTIVGNFNISGGTVNIANNTTFGAAIRMSNSAIATGLIANSDLNLTGGTLTVAGHILKGVSTGAGTATVTLNGGTLDMSGNNIGSATGTVNLAAQSGTLQSLNELNNGAALVKTTAGILTLAGSNNYTGATQVNDGTVNFSTVAAGATAQGLGRNAVTLGVAATSSGTLNYTGAAGTLDKNINALGNGTDTIANNGTGQLTLSGILTKNGTHLTLNAASNSINVTGTIVGASAGSDLFVSGGTTTISSTGNTYNGATTVNTGATLAVSGSLSGTTGATVQTGGTLLLNSSAGTPATQSNIIGTVTAGPQTTLGTTSTTAALANGGTLAVAGSQSATTHTFAALTLTGTGNILDFSQTGSNINVNLVFASLSAGQTATGLALGTLDIKNWAGSIYGIGQTTDGGSLLDGQDRLLFTADPGFTQGIALSGISFNNGGVILPGMAVTWNNGTGTQYEIVPVPEPATTALIGAVALCALIGYRERRRFTGIRSRMARK